MIGKSKGLVFPTSFNNDAIIDLSLEYSQEFQEFVSCDKNPISKEKAHRREQALSVDNLNPIKMMPLMYEFILALTPLALIKANIIAFFTWKDPKKTALHACAISVLLLLDQKISAMALLGFFLMSKKIIPIIIQAKPLQDDAKSSMDKYKRNAVLMRVKLSI